MNAIAVAIKSEYFAFGQFWKILAEMNYILVESLHSKV